MQTLQKISVIVGIIIFTVQAHAVMYLARPYDPNMGRWLTRDPIGERGGPNVYAMVNNDPINDTDPLGFIAYDFDRKNCTLTARIKWRLKFVHDPRRAWSPQMEEIWKKRAESAVENYFSTLSFRCFPSGTKCCACPSGVSTKVDLTYGWWFADYTVTVVLDPKHRSGVGSNGVADFDVADPYPQDKGASMPQVPIVHETGHMLV